MKILFLCVEVGEIILNSISYVKISDAWKISSKCFVNFVNSSFFRPMPFIEVESIKDLKGDTFEIYMRSEKNIEKFGVKCLSQEEIQDFKITKIIDLSKSMKYNNLILICKNNVFKCKSAITNLKVELERRNIQICIFEVLKDETFYNLV